MVLVVHARSRLHEWSNGEAKKQLQRKKPVARASPRESLSNSQMRLAAGVGENVVVTSVRARRLARLRLTRRWVDTAGSTYGEGFLNVDIAVSKSA